MQPVAGILRAGFRCINGCRCLNNRKRRAAVTEAAARYFLRARQARRQRAPVSRGITGGILLFVAVFSAREAAENGALVRIFRQCQIFEKIFKNFVLFRMLRAYHVSGLKNGPVGGGLAAAVTAHRLRESCLVN